MYVFVREPQTHSCVTASNLRRHCAASAFLAIDIVDNNTLYLSTCHLYKMSIMRIIFLSFLLPINKIKSVGRQTFTRIILVHKFHLHAVDTGLVDCLA